MSILTATQAANALRVLSTDPRLVDLLPIIDEYIQQATGRDWSEDATIHKIAVSVATMLLVQWYEDPGAMGGMGDMPHGITAQLTMLEAEALKYRKYTFTGINGAGAVSLPGARIGDEVIKLLGIYGASGSQTASFESTISETDQIQQSSGADLSETIFVVILKNPADDVMA